MFFFGLGIMGRAVNRYEARRRLDGRWDWTVENDGVIQAAGPCALHEDGHAAKGEAERHFYNDQMDHLIDVAAKGDVLYRCLFPGCETFTNKGLTAHGWSWVPTWLCERHSNKNCFMNVNPFHSDIKIWSSV